MIHSEIIGSSLLHDIIVVYEYDYKNDFCALIICLFHFAIDDVTNVHDFSESDDQSENEEPRAKRRSCESYLNHHSIFSVPYECREVPS